MGNKLRQMRSKRRHTSQRQASQPAIPQASETTVPHTSNHEAEQHPNNITSRAFSLEDHMYESSTPIDELTQDLGNYTYLVCPHSLKDVCLHCGHRTAHNNCVVIAVDGFCPNNGRPGGNVFSSAGVYVGEGSQFNGGYTLVDENATNQTAELKAGIRGLETVLRIYSMADVLDQDNKPRVIIKTDSKYMYEGVTDHIYKWKTNGWLTSARKAVANQALWIRLDELVDEVESEGIQVSFWWVPRKFNREADHWAEYGMSVVTQRKIDEAFDTMSGGNSLIRYSLVHEMIREHPEQCFFLLAGQGQKFYCEQELGAYEDWAT